MIVQSRPIADPQPGFFRLRVHKGGPWTPAVIFRPCPLEMHDVWCAWHGAPLRYAEEGEDQAGAPEF